MIEVNVQKNYNFLYDNHTKYTGLLLQGGSRSAKTTDVCQFIIWYCLNNTGKTITIGRDTLTALKATLLIDFKQVLLWWGRKEIVSGVNPKIEINGNLIRFIGVNDDVMKTHGMTQDVFWLNEAINIKKDTIDQLEQRTSEFFILDYNPKVLNHYLYSMDNRDDVITCKSTVLDNRFVPLKAKKKILSYEPTPDNIERGTANEEKWNIYGLGLPYKGDEIIYQKWETYTDEPVNYDYVYNGLDWGFNDPLVLVKVWFSDNNIYIKQMYYKGNLDINDTPIKDVVGIIKANGDLTTVCDSSEPRSIADLIRKGVKAYKARKGAGSILTGIRRMQQKNIFVHEDSVDVISELNNYKWKTDIRTDTITDVPLDKHNHSLDSIRYIINTFEI